MLNLIVSPSSKSKIAEKNTKKIVKFLKKENIEFSVYFSFTTEEMCNSVKTLYSEGETEYVVIGDDATLGLFVNNIKDLSKIKLGIVPSGKSCDFARYLGLQQNPIQAIKDILKKEITSIDYMILNDMKVINNILIGLPAEIEDNYKQLKVQNFITYKYSTMKLINVYEGINLDILEGKESKTTKPTNAQVFDLVISNGGLSKNKTVSPLSNMQDGLINVTYLTVPPKNEKRKSLKSLNNGTQIYNDNAQLTWASNIKITTENNQIKAIVDGELYTLDKLEISMVESGLKIYKNQI